MVEREHFSGTWQRDRSFSPAVTTLGGKIVWVAGHGFGEGMFTVTAEDGEDLDGNGTIEVPAEGDGDLSDDASETFTLTVTGSVAGTTQTARAVVTPVPVSGIVRLAIEGAIFISAIWALNASGYTGLSWGFAMIVVIHYAISYDRLLWLLNQ